MQIDTPATYRHEVHRYAVVAIAVILAMLVVVPIFRRSSMAPTAEQNSGIVPVRIVAAQSKPPSSTDSPLVSGVVVRAMVRARSSDAKAARSALASVSSDQADGTLFISAEDQARYEDVLYNHIAKFIRYPHAALHVCPSGTTYVRFQSDRQGQLLSIVIEQSSGCAIIDDEAVKTVRRAQPLPSVPDVFPGRMTIRMPLSFGKS